MDTDVWTLAYAPAVFKSASWKTYLGSGVTRRTKPQKQQYKLGKSKSL